jgi:hypothetical protein
MKTVILILVTLFSFYGCTIKSVIPFTPVEDNAVYSAKVPAKASFLLKDESEKYTKTENEQSGITVLYIVPSGQIINGAAKDVLPNYFEKTDFVGSAGDVKDGVIISADLVDYRPTVAIGFSEGVYKAELSLRVRMQTEKGSELYTTTAFADAQGRKYNAFSGASAGQAWGEQTYDAFRSAMKKALDNIMHSYAVVEYLSGSSGAVIQNNSPVKQNTTEKDLSGMSDKEKLRYAFENGDISSDQLSKAIEDLNSGNPSKILQSFINGSIDSKTFSDLY